MTTTQVRHSMNAISIGFFANIMTEGCEKELLLRKLDLLSIVRTEGDWTFVENAITKSQGFVPTAFIAPNMSLNAEDWFFGHLSRQKVALTNFCSLINADSFFDRQKNCFRTPCVNTDAFSSAKVRFAAFVVSCHLLQSNDISVFVDVNSLVGRITHALSFLISEMIRY